MASPDSEKCKLCKKGKKGVASCSYCQAFYHLSCIKITSTEWESLRKLAPKGARWICQECLSEPASASTPTVRKLEDKLDTRMNELEMKMEGSIKSLTQKIDASLNANLSSTKQALTEQEKQISLLSKNSWAQVVSGVDKSVEKVSKEVIKVRDTVEEDKQRRDKADRELREKNLVIFGIKETESYKTDVEEVQDLLDTHAFLHGLSFNVQSANLTRLGRRSDQKTRPIRLTLCDRESKWEVLKRINRMDIRGVFARPDLNQEEQEADFKLRTALKKKREEDPEGHWKIIRGEIKKVDPPPSKRRHQDSITEEEAQMAQETAEEALRKNAPAK